MNKEPDFYIDKVVENGYPHWKITNKRNGKIIQCDLNELNEVMYELLGVTEE